MPMKTENSAILLPVQNPVYFEEITRMIPDNAVVVEIAPHSLLQAILKKSLKNCTHIPLTRRGNPDGVKYLLEAIGKLYLAGFNPKVETLYPTVMFPVSTETPLLSHLVEWEHSEDWPLMLGKKQEKVSYISRNIVFSLQDDDYKYLEGHFRNGVNVLPEAAFLAFVWETLAMYKGKDFRDLSVVFKDIQFHSEIIIMAEAPVRLTVMISKGNNTFEVTQENKLIVAGKVNAVKVLKHRHTIDSYYDPAGEIKDDVKLTSRDIYRLLKVRGYDYKGMFQSMLTTNLMRNKALIKWTENWVLFLDSLMQLNTISKNLNTISKPKFIRRLGISVVEQSILNTETYNGLKCYDAKISYIYGVTRCAGVEISDIIYTDIPQSEQITTRILESRVFFPFITTEKVDIKTALEMNLHIISENSLSSNILITKVVTSKVSHELDFIDKVADKVFLENSKIRIVRNDIDKMILTASQTQKVNETDVIVIEKLLQYPKKIDQIQRAVTKDTFLLSFEDAGTKLQSPLRDTFNTLSYMSDGKKILVLMKIINRDNNTPTCYIPIKFDDTFSWVPNVLNKLNKTERIILISEKQPSCGVLGFVKKLKAQGYSNIAAVIINGLNSPIFDLNNDLYKKQLQKNLTINILKEGQWGSLYNKSSKMLVDQKGFALKNLTKNLNNLSWVEIPTEDKALVQVCYSGLSINDENEIMNKDNSEVKSDFGMDFSGFDSHGDKIMGLIAGGSVASFVEVDNDLIWPVPDHWTLEDAATVPLAYVQAYYCLVIRSQIKKGQSVLILDGTSSVGLALIRICISFECAIFTVVNSKDKQRTLLALFPELSGNLIIYSCYNSFYSNLMTDTKGQGCDFVINFDAGHVREAAVSCVGCFGYFLDFSKMDIYENKTIGMSFLNQDRSYMCVDVANIFRPEFSRDRKILQKYIIQGIKCGEVRPLTRVVFSPLQVNQAFTVLSLNKHIGKVLIRVKDPCISSNGLETVPRISFTPQDVLIIVCDEKGIGIEITNKLIKRGARKIILHLKTSLVSGYIHTNISTWSKQKVSIKLSSDNLQTKKGSETLIKNAMDFGTVKGIFVMFDSKRTDNGMKDDFIDAYKKQAVIVMNLDTASRNLIDLSHFVILSRFTQSASDEYALSLTERVCDMRNEMGLATLVVRYESLVEFDDYKSKIDKIQSQSISTLFNAIETGLKLKYRNIVTFDLGKERKECINKTPNEDGMYTFYKHVETEEDHVTSQTLVELPTLLNYNGTNAGCDSNDSYIILIPGFEGKPQIFESAAERLKMRAISVKLEPDVQRESIQKIALDVKEELQKRLGNSNRQPFNILGYSFGVNIALELAALLEKEGKTGIVYCIDSSPDTMRIILDKILGNISTDHIENHVLNHMYKLITGVKDNSLEADLRNLDTYEGKIKECVKRMKGLVNYSLQYKKHVLESALKKISLSREYKPEIMLKSTIVLMKSSFHLTGECADDYGLSKYTEKPVKVFKLGAEHATAPFDIRVSNIINRCADGNGTGHFNKINLCDMYTIN